MNRPLTARQREVIGLLWSGLGHKRVADRLGISVTTVKSHLARAADALALPDVKSVTLCRRAIELGLLPIELDKGR